MTEKEKEQLKQFEQWAAQKGFSQIEWPNMFQAWKAGRDSGNETPLNGNETARFERYCQREGIEPGSREESRMLAVWIAALDGARQIPIFEAEKGDNLIISFPWILNRFQRKAFLETLRAALADKRPFMVLDGNPNAAILRGGVSIPCIVADGAEIKNPNPLGPLTVEMIDAGEFALSEWLNDDAPIGQGRYRQPAIEAFKAMMEAAPPVPYGFSISPRPPEFGDGWNVKLFENGVEAGGGAFPVGEYPGDDIYAQRFEAYEAALVMANEWILSRAPGPAEKGEP